MTNKLFTSICLALTLTACAGIYHNTDTPKSLTMPAEPYHCTGLDSPFPQDWNCTYEGIELPEGEQQTMRMNIQINRF